MKKLTIITIAIVLSISQLIAQNTDIVGHIALGYPLISIYITPDGVDVPDEMQDIEIGGSSIKTILADLIETQVPELLDKNMFDDNGYTTKEEVTTVMQFPDLTDYVGITNQRYYATFRPLEVMVDEDNRKSYYLANLIPARLIYLTPHGLETSGIPQTDAERVKKYMSQWFPTGNKLNNLFDNGTCAAESITIYALLPDFVKTIGTTDIKVTNKYGITTTASKGYYQLTFTPDNSVLSTKFGGDGKTNGYYYLSSMQRLSDLPPLKFDGTSWSWLGENIEQQNKIISDITSKTSISEFMGMYMMEVKDNAIGNYLPGLTIGKYLLDFNPDDGSLSYDAMLSKELNIIDDFPSDNNINSIFNNNEPIMDVVLILKENIAKLYINVKNIYGINAYIALYDYIYEPHENILSSMFYDVTTLYNLKVGFLHITDGSPIKFYITGSGENLYSGGVDSEGFLYFRGQENQQLDLYIENLNILSMDDTPWQMTFGGIVFPDINLDKAFYMRDSKTNNVFDLLGFGNGTKYTRGCSAPISFGSASVDMSKPFRPNIHIKGHNTLTGGAQSYYTDESVRYLSNNALAATLVEGVFGIELSTLVNIFAEGVTRMVAPSIAIRPYTYDHSLMTQEFMLKSSTLLTIDDKWVDGSRTNGSLDMPIKYDVTTGECPYDHSAPSIDYGTASSMVVFDGGQYRLTTAAKTTTVLSTGSHAIAHRFTKFNVNINAFGGAKDINLFNTGPSIGREEAKDENAIAPFNVKILNGTFSTYSAEEYKDKTDVLTEGIYNSYTDLRLPYNTDILGGSYNCDAYRVSDATQRGLAPIYVPQEGDTVVLCRRDSLLVNIASDKDTIMIKDINSKHNNRYDYIYNVSGLNAETDGNVHLYLPCIDQNTDVAESFINNYVTLFPKVGIQKLMEMGGPVHVSSTYKDKVGGIPVKNAFLLRYLPNKYTLENTKIEVAGKPYSFSQVMPGGDDDWYAGTVNNEGGYTIEYGIYMMQSFMSNQWYLFSPPYDVAKVYVVETGNVKYQGKSVNDIDSEEYIKYLNDQAATETDVVGAIFNRLLPEVTNEEVSGSGPFQDFISFLSNIKGVTITELVHYNPNIEGHKSFNAHYYLYREYDEMADMDGEWRISNNTADYSKNWKYIEPETDGTWVRTDGTKRPIEEQTILMEKNQIYSFFLPAGKDRYWDNKYLIFEGYGPQILDGTNTLKSYIRDAQDGILIFQGNNTFANYEAKASTGSLYQLNKDAGNAYTFSQHKGLLTLHPGEVYIIANSITSPNMVIRNTDETADETIPRIENILLKAWSEHGMNIATYRDTHVEVMSADGKNIWSGNMKDGEIKHLIIPNGVYIIHSEEQTLKLIVNN